MTLYSKICDANRVKYGTEAERILQIIINQYSDRTHFIYEILQNAEDAGATYIKFKLEHERLLIFHNGRPFNEADIEGVCGIANGTKEDGTRIGHFGIGFKSVYCYTEKPQIYSGQYHFVIKNQLFPEEISAKAGLSYEETCMILPFDKKDVRPEIAYQEISEALTKKLTAESVLILNSIQDLEIQISGWAENKRINKLKSPIGDAAERENVFALSLQTTIINVKTGQSREHDSDYLFFTDAEKEAVALIFKVDGGEDGERELQPVRNTKIYAFFPTAKESHQNFYIHAPFDTTPARDNFKEGAEYGKHNLYLVKNIGNLICFAFLWMRDHHYLTAAGLNAVFPIYEYNEEDILYDLYQNSIDIIGEESLIPTSVPGEFKRVEEVCFPLWGVISETFDTADLRRLYGNRKLNWLAKEVLTEAYRDFRVFLKRNFTFNEIDWIDLVLKMDALFLKQKDLSWIERLTDRIESYCIRKSVTDSHYIDASKVPFVRTSRGEQIFARDENGKLLVYLNNPDIARFRIDAAFLKSDIIYSFYSRVLRIPVYNVEQETIENILPKYITRQPRFVTNNYIEENISDLKAIKDAIQMNPSVLEKIKDKYIVTDGKEWFIPSELYIPSGDTRTGYSLIKDICDIRYLSDRYYDGSITSLRIDDDYFRKIGCNYGIRINHVDKEEYLSMVKHYANWQVANDLRQRIFSKTYISKKMDWAFNYEGFPEVFRNMSRERSLAIIRFLNQNAMDFDITGELVGADDQHFSGKNVDSAVAYTALGLQLCFENWIYIKGDESPHKPIEVDVDDILDEYHKFGKRVVGNLPFKEEKNALSEWLDKNFEDTSDKELVKRLMSSPEELIHIVKQMAKAEARKEAKGKGSIKDLIKKGDVEQSDPSTSNSTSGFEVNPISENAKRRREENLDKLLAETLDNFTQMDSRVKGVQFGSRKSNLEERIFLEAEYGGRCQICSKQIVKYNGEQYYEAINILKFYDLPDVLQRSDKYGWNSLCLCPNCAAEYNNCSKKISTMYDQIMRSEVETDSEEPIEIHIEMPKGTGRTIHYSPRHFLALKEALKIFADVEEK